MPARLARPVLALAGLGLTVVTLSAFAASAPEEPSASAPVGRQPDGSVLLPTGQRITPTGRQTELFGRPNAVAVRPGGGYAAVLVASSGTQLRVLDLASGSWVSSSDALAEAASYDGLAWSPDGRTLAASGADGEVLLEGVDARGILLPATARRVTIPKASVGANAQQDPYPGGLAFSADGTSLYVALSRDNALGVVDVAAGALTARIPVGNAPHSVLVDGRTAYVTNEGGRPAGAADPTNDSAGTRIVTDGRHGGTATGTVSVVDLASGRETRTITVGLHPTGMALSGRQLLVANTNDDTLSVVDLSGGATRTLSLSPYDGAPLGSGPTAVTVLPDGRAAVTLGLADALAVVDLDPHLGKHATALQGLVPTAWYPSDVGYDSASGQLVVANLHGVGSTADADAGRAVRGLGEVGSVSILPVPSVQQLDDLTDRVFEDNAWAVGGHARPRAQAALPKGIEHVVYVVKENRTYDQLLGDVGRGNSDPDLAQFGKAVTPNTHALATQFPLLDNCYDAGRRSNDGHQWAMQGAAPDYLEKGVTSRRSNVLGLGHGTPPSSGFDALLYLRSGFIWEDALEHGKTFADFGEYTVEGGPPPALSDVPTLEPYVVPEFSGFELTQPDVYRARVFANHLAGYEATGQMPDLITLTLPNDHTGGSNPLYPTPETQVADNDQGLGQIVDAISHSSFWPTTAVFVVEDDTQGGPDHVEGHRGPCLVISPYAKHGGYVDSTRYGQPSVLRTIELLLGLPPMNELDAHAVPMTAAFQQTPDLTPFTALVPAVLQGGPVHNPPLSRLSGMQRLWALSAMQQDFRHRDAANAVLLDHDVWYSTHRWAVPYPGEGRVLTPAEVLALHLDTED